ncbi:MAG: RrF2 family transcriptional regulator [Eubacteriales bacterium]|jgi:Rrf2 family protein
MRISTRGRYALRLMLELALRYPDGHYTTLREISRAQQISIKYLEQIISPLSHAGMVQSIRGAQGGYRLAREPEDYTVGEILRLTEGSLAPVPCVEPAAEACPRQDQCATLLVWQDLKQAIDQVVDRYTLADLVQEVNKKSLLPQ